MWLLPPVEVMRRQCKRIALASRRASRPSVAGRSATTVEAFNLVADPVDLGVGHGHVQRQHQAALEEAVRAREVLGEAELALAMDGAPAPLDQGADATLLELRLQRVAVIGLDLIVLVDVEPARVGVRGWRQTDPLQAAQMGVIARGDGPAARHDPVVAAQTMAQDRGLQIVEPAVERPALALAAVVHAEAAQLQQDLMNGGIVGDHRAAIAQAAQRLGRVEADRGGDAEGACRLSVELRSQGLGGIFKQQQPAPLADGADRIHVAGAAVEIGRHHRPGARRDRWLDRGGIDAAVGSDFDRNGHATGRMHCRRCRLHGVAAHDDFVARPDAAGDQGEVQAVGGVVHADREAAADVGGQLALEVGEILLQDEGPTPTDIAEDADQFLFLVGEEGGIVEEGDGGHVFLRAVR